MCFQVHLLRHRLIASLPSSLPLKIPRHVKLLLHVPCYQAYTSIRAISTSPDSYSHDFFHYTSGRWLWDEEKQFQARYKPFNISKLQNVAVTSIGAQACQSMVKLGEGGFNKVFRLTMDNGSIVIARIPNPDAGNPGKTIASEVATMDFVRSTLVRYSKPKKKR